MSYNPTVGGDMLAQGTQMKIRPGPQKSFGRSCLNTHFVLVWMFNNKRPIKDRKTIDSGKYRHEKSSAHTHTHTLCIVKTHTATQKLSDLL